MKKNLYLSLCALFMVMLFSSKARAQYTITGTSIMTTSLSCGSGVTSITTVSAYTTGLTVKSFWGDGSSSTATVSSGKVSYGSHTYYGSGTYTIKHVLLSGTAPIDSVTDTHSYTYCTELRAGGYYDANSNCIYDAGDNIIYYPSNVEVDSAGIPVDTIQMLSGYTYMAYGAPGTVYAFKILTPPTGLINTCPTGGILYDTVPYPGDTSIIRYFGFECGTSSGFDLAEMVTMGGPGRHSAYVDAIVSSNTCTPTAATFTMTFSPKFGVYSATPTPTSIVGNVVTWNFSGLSATSPRYVSVHFETPVLAWLTPGDTIHSSYVLTPITGDSNPANNTISRVDTVRASWDPNYKSVSPEGNIMPGAKLQYFIAFENTGNDTAYNIHVQDTLSANLDPQTVQVTTSSAPAKVSQYVAGTYNIIKFDFPNIKLPDSSHHGLCHGFVTFSANAKSSLVSGDKINNRVGIYFDANEVVMTNTVTNQIPYPARTSIINTNIVDIYPNPVNDQLTIKADNAAYNSLTITNTLGQVVLTQAINTTQTKVNVKTLTPGIYYISLRGESGITVRKFEKQ